MIYITVIQCQFPGFSMNISIFQYFSWIFTRSSIILYNIMYYISYFSILFSKFYQYLCSEFSKNPGISVYLTMATLVFKLRHSSFMLCWYNMFCFHSEFALTVRRRVEEHMKKNNLVRDSVLAYTCRLYIRVPSHTPWCLAHTHPSQVFSMQHWKAGMGKAKDKV